MRSMVRTIHGVFCVVKLKENMFDIFLVTLTQTMRKRKINTTL